MVTRNYGEPSLDGSPEALIGRKLAGRYRVEAILDEGGAAVVYRAIHVDLDRPVAVKVIQSIFASDEEVRGRFEREARALAALSHPHIVNLIDYGVDRDAPYLVMELLEGRSLRELLDEQGKLPPERSFDIMRQVLRALAFAHDRGLLHRDLKPGNVFLQALPDTADHVKLLDFGLAKFVAGTGQDGAPLTRVGTVSGTPTYMAPEQASGRPMDARTDVYAAAIVLFEMLSGRRPFEGSTTEVMQRKLVATAPALGEAARDLQVRPELERLLACALAREPDERFADVHAMAAALEQIPQPAVTAAPSRSRAPATETSSGPTTLPTWLPPVVLVAPLLGGLLVCGGVGTWLISAATGEQRAAASSPERSGPLPFGDLGEADPGAEGAEGVAAPDPWAGPPPPTPLDTIHAKIEAGERVTGGELRQLRAFAREHPDDPRPFLLTGHALVQRGARSSAIPRYERAWRTDEQARGDPRMLENLVTMAAESTRDRRAVQTLERIYGEEAVPALERYLDSEDLNVPRRRRVQQLIERLRR